MRTVRPATVRNFTENQYMPLSLRTILTASFLCLSGFTTITAASLDGSDKAPETNVRIDSLLAALSGEEEEIQSAVEGLVSLNNPQLHGFLEGLFKGSVYWWPQSNEASPILVVAGQESIRNDTLWVSLYRPYPFEALPGSDGNPLLVEPEYLVELETDRAMRSAIQPFLTAMQLLDPETDVRKTAARNLASAGNPSVISIIDVALEKEAEKSVTYTLLESKYRLQLLSEDPMERLAAVKGLADLHSVYAVSDLKFRVTPDENGAYPESEAAIREEINRSLASIKSWMQVTDWLQNLFSGISLGSILILMALGLAVIFGLMGVINMAHGEFMMIGAYATFVVQGLFMRYMPESQFGWFFPASLPAAFLVAGGMGLLVEYLIIRRLYGRPLETLLATWGVSLLLIQGARHLFGDLTSVSTPPLLSQGWEIFPSVVLPYNRLFIIALTAVIVFGMAILFYRTSLGMRIRAVTQNRSMSSCLGVPTRRIDALTFALGTGIAGVAGWAMTQVGNVDPGMGQNYIVDSFLVVVTGGVGKLTGALFSGLGIGVLNKFLEPYLQAVYAKVALLVIVILFLQQKPSGLFPAKGRYEDG